MEETFEGGSLSLVGHDLEEIPVHLAEKYPEALTVDLSYNAIKQISHLDGFSKLEHLIFDNNQLEGVENLPSFPQLQTLSVNNNQIADLDRFLTEVKSKAPNLNYLSLLKNPACPNFFTGKRDEEYIRYRCTVIYNLPGLKFLDSSPVTESEQKEAARRGHLLRVARPSDEQYARKSTAKNDGIRELPPSERRVGQTRASMGVSRYVYQGRQSEGNRFIGNNDL